jgi:hypothetical protein
MVNFIENILSKIQKFTQSDYLKKQNNLNSE